MKEEEQDEREESGGEEKYEDTSHCALFLFFLICHCSGLSLERKREIELLGGMMRKSERCWI